MKFMVKEVTTQGLFKGIFKSLSILLCVCGLIFAYNVLFHSAPIKQDVIAKGKIINKDLSFGGTYVFTFENTGPIKVSSETYEKFNKGDSVILTRPNAQSQNIKEFSYLGAIIIGAISLVYVISIIVSIIVFLKLFIDWGCNHSNTVSFKDYLRDKKV